MNKQILVAVAISAAVTGTAQAAGFFDSLKEALGGGKSEPQTAQTAPAPATPATAATLTPEQLKVKATLEKVVMCQQELKYSEIIKLVESFPGTQIVKTTDAAEGDNINEYAFNIPLQPWGLDTYVIVFAQTINPPSPLETSVTFDAKTYNVSTLAKKAKFKASRKDELWRWWLNTNQGLLQLDDREADVAGYFSVMCLYKRYK